MTRPLQMQALVLPRGLAFTAYAIHSVLGHKSLSLCEVQKLTPRLVEQKAGPTPLNKGP